MPEDVGRSLKLAQRVELDIEAFVRASGSLSASERDAWRGAQRSAYEEAFLHAGVVHPRFRAVVEGHFDKSGEVLARLAARFALPASAG